LERACKLAGIDPEGVDLTQTMHEKVEPRKLDGDFRVINFDGRQITISERINGERRLRGFLADEHSAGQRVEGTQPGSDNRGAANPL